MKTLKQLFRYVKPYRVCFFAAAVILVVNIGLNMINPYLQKLLINRVLLGNQRKLLIYLLAGMLLISIVTSAFGYLYSYLVEYTSQMTMADIRHKMFLKLQNVSFSFYDKSRTGELMSRMTGDLDGVRAYIPNGFLQLFNCIITFTGTLCILIRISWKLTLVCLILSPFTITTALKFDKKIRKAYDKLRKQYAVMNTTLQENITGIRVVKAFAQEKREIQKFKKENTVNMERGIDIGFISGKYAPVMWFIGDLSFVFLLWFGGMLVVKNELTLGDVVQFNGYLWSMIWPLRNLPGILNMYEQCIASGERIFNILDTKPEIMSPENPVKMDQIKGHVVFDHVSMKYNDNIILKDICLDVKPGEKIAVMGATGSGKTSLVNLIGRYYDTADGEILIDGVSVKDYDLKDLRNNIGIVMQETFLYSDTIKNNITFGNKEAEDEEIVEAAKASEADEFIEQMPEGYDTVVGERGVGLSGGQKQRIAIARAIVKNPAILILDDATASVDMETEQRIQLNLRKITEGHTTFIIAHRISSVKDADEIVVLDNGSIAERGTHEQLINLKGRYYSNYMEQNRAFLNRKITRNEGNGVSA